MYGLLLCTNSYEFAHRIFPVIWSIFIKKPTAVLFVEELTVIKLLINARVKTNISSFEKSLILPDVKLAEFDSSKFDISKLIKEYAFCNQFVRKLIQLAIKFKIIIKLENEEKVDEEHIIIQSQNFNI